MKYFYSNKIIEADLPEYGYITGTDIKEFDIHVPLSNIQLQFLIDNPTATALEVWNCKLDIITPEVSFDYASFIDSLVESFPDSLYKIPDLFLELLERRKIDSDASYKTYFQVLRTYLEQIKEVLISENEYNQILSLFKNQNIDLSEYSIDTALLNSVFKNLDGQIFDKHTLVTELIDGLVERDFITGKLFFTNGTERTLIGEKGDTGEQGLQGIQGIKGDKGDKGDGYSILRSTATTSTNTPILSLDLAYNRIYYTITGGTGDGTIVLSSYPVTDTEITIIIDNSRGTDFKLIFPTANITNNGILYTFHKMVDSITVKNGYTAEIDVLVDIIDSTHISLRITSQSFDSKSV